MHISRFVLTVIAGACVAAPAFATTNLIDNGQFTSVHNGGVGQQNWDANGVTYGATAWINREFAPDVIGFNFLFADGNAGSTGVFGAVKLWTAANGGSNSWDGLSSAGANQNFMALDGAERTSAITQTVNGLTPGDQYTLFFSYAFAQQYTFDGPTVQSLHAFVQPTFDASTPSWTSATVNLPNHAFSGWAQANTTFTATAASEVVAFLAEGSPAIPPFALVGDVTLLADQSGPPAIPEPAVWTLLLGGFAGVGAVRWRRRRKAALPI